MQSNKFGIVGAAAIALATLGTLGALAPIAGAQSAQDSSLYIRAQQMVSNGDAATGRHLVDSLVNAAPVGSVQYAEGLYWRAVLAANARDAERDYRQIVVDYPLSRRVPGALLRMGQLEATRGDRDAALQHFQRLVVEHPESPLHAEASYWLAHAYFDKNDAQHGCAANADALAQTKPTDVELRNRIAFQQQRCRGVLAAATPAAAPAAAPAAPPVMNSTAAPVAAPRRESTTVAVPVMQAPPTPRAESSAAVASVKTTTSATRAVAKSSTKTTPPKALPERPAAPATSSTGSYAVQVAAFSTKPQADALAVKLRGRGYSVHVDGTSAPYRVRIGSFPTYVAAAAELHRLKTKQIDGFVAER